MSFKRFVFLLLTSIVAVCGAQADAWARQAADVSGGGAVNATTAADTLPSSPAARTNAPVRAARDLSRYEGRTVESVDVVIEEAASDAAALAEFRSLLRIAPNRRFTAVAGRESLQALFDSQRVARARIEASDAPGQSEDGRPRVALRFIIRPQVVVAGVEIELGALPPAAPVTEDELRARLNLLEPGKPASEQSVRSNADAIQVYLRDRGFYRASVESEQRLDDSKTRSTITYRVALGEQATVSSLSINITGFDDAPLRPALSLRAGAVFTQSALGEDLGRIRQAIIAGGHLAPRINEPRAVLDSATNTIAVSVTGSIGPKVNVEVKVAEEIAGYKLSEKAVRELLPVKREGNISASSILEGARRLRNRLQEEGYFFADVVAVCTVTPPLAAAAPLSPDEVAPDVCQLLNPEEMSGSQVNITYRLVGDVPGQTRRYKLTNIRLEGTDKLTIDDVRDDLRTQEANALGIIPFFGLGRGYTSDQALEQDTRIIRARMSDLGYRHAVVTVRRGVSPEGENLIITFVVDEHRLTRVAGIEIRGNQLYTAERLRDEACPAERLPEEVCTIVGGPFSRSAARADADRIRTFYARNGYLDAEVNLSIVDLPDKGDDEQVRLIYTVKEADKVFINQIFINGNVETKREAILKTISLRPGEILRADNITESERNLYATDAFRQVIIRAEPAGETAGFKKRDIIIDLEERKRYVMDYGGGYSTDNGPLGLFEIRNSNLFGALRQGALRTRGSNRQQLFRLEYFDPRFRRYGVKEFAPLVVSAQYQRDTTVTRFFRSTLDQGTSGIVQRLNEEGKPIDIDCPLPDLQCEVIGSPTINRFTINAETQRDIELELGPRGEVRKRSTLFLRYNYEDVRLYNIQSLLIASILRPDRAVRLSRFGATFARDTRDRALDATRGEFLTVDYALALRQFGGNLSFSKLQATYRRYYKVARARDTVLAAAVQLGLASLYQPTD
ncbi:MAG TPA: POTRA domain-containing protein, partial [Pyrinomonadaceae bacterium]|nr:POTRA domain-containing protein [Pyrinomonadaceae bacterium]